MSNQIELEVEARAISGKQVRQLRRDGFVPANIYGHNAVSVAVQVQDVTLQKLLAHRGNNVIQLKVGSQPAVQVLIKQVQRNLLSGKALHVDFYRLAASEKLKAPVQLHFVNTTDAADLGQMSVSRSLNDVMVECLPADFPTNIKVDLSKLKEAGDVIRVGDLEAGPGVTILNDHNDPVAGLYQQAHGVEAEAVIEKAETSVTASETAQ